MYHGIDDLGGATSVAPETFDAQMQVLAESGRPVLSLDAWLDGGMAEDAVIVTFDDAFTSFADVALPILSRHGFPAIVYVPTGGSAAARTGPAAIRPGAPSSAGTRWPRCRGIW